MGDEAERMFEDFWLEYEFDNESFCKYCNRGPFEWIETSKGWRLQTEVRHLIHHCKQYYKKKEKEQKLMTESETKTVKTFFIAGVQHHPVPTAIKNLIEEGVKLILTPEPTNKFDSNAIKIEYHTHGGDHMLGYVPKKYSSTVSASLTIGKTLECILTKFNKNASPWEMYLVEIREVLT